MSSSPVISIVVPVYNVEKYIKKCLLSIQNQTFTDFEVLVVDDESSDHSPEIIREFTDHDERFTIYRKKNEGTSMARNYGISLARGEYITFIDSDDYIREDFLEVLYHECVDNDADVACCRFKYAYTKTGLNMPMIFSPKKQIMSGRKAMIMTIHDTLMKNYAWNKLYKRSLFTGRDIHYPTMYFEDIATTGRVIFHANKVAVTDQYLYYYVQRDGSLMTTMSAQRISDYARSVLIIKNYVMSNGQYQDYKKAIHYFVRRMHLVNIYSVARMHILTRDLKNMKHNLDINRDLSLFLMDDNYQYVEEPEIPVYFIQPGKSKEKVKGRKSKR